jgi:4,5-DOPA dioxygenase extradiol
MTGLVILNEKVKKMILDGDHEQLINLSKHDDNYRLAVPSPDHYLPLLYILGVQMKDDHISFFQ